MYYFLPVLCKYQQVESLHQLTCRDGTICMYYNYYMHDTMEQLREIMEQLRDIRV